MLSSPALVTRHIPITAQYSTWLSWLRLVCHRPLSLYACSAFLIHEWTAGRRWRGGTYRGLYITDRNQFVAYNMWCSIDALLYASFFAIKRQQTQDKNCENELSHTRAPLLNDKSKLTICRKLLQDTIYILAIWIPMARCQIIGSMHHNITSICFDA